MGQKKWVIRWKLGIYGEGTENKGIYTDYDELMEDYKQCVFLQPENEYRIEEVN